MYLALTRTPQPREQLAALFWPDRDVAAARNVVRTTLRRLRRHLAAAGGTTVAALTLLRGERDALGREGVGLARDGTPRRRGAARPRHRARPAPWRLATGGARPG